MNKTNILANSRDLAKIDINEADPHIMEKIRRMEKKQQEATHAQNFIDLNIKSLVLGNVQASLVKEFEDNMRLKKRDVALSTKMQSRRHPKVVEKERKQKMNF